MGHELEMERTAAKREVISWTMRGEGVDPPMELGNNPCRNNNSLPLNVTVRILYRLLHQSLTRDGMGLDLLVDFHKFP